MSYPHAPIRFGLEGFVPRLDNPGPYTFSIYLEGDFARACRALLIDRGQQEQFNVMGAKIVKDILRDTHRTPYMFERGSFLLAQCSLGRDGRWLSGDYNDLCALEKAPSIGYTGHNIDTPAQAVALLSLFTTWAEYAGALLSR